jgi:hypothetical protein
MNVESAVLPFERPFVKAFKAWGEDTVTLALLLCAAFIVYIALQKDNLIIKSVLLAYVLLP